MPNRSLEDILTAVDGKDPIIITADANGDGVDLRGFDGALIIGHVGASGDTLSGSVYLELEVEESDDNTTFTDVADADLTTTVTGTNTGTFALINDPAEDAALYQTSYIGAKRYIRAVANVTGTHTNGIEVGFVVVKGYPHLAP